MALTAEQRQLMQSQLQGGQPQAMPTTLPQQGGKLTPEQRALMLSQLQSPPPSQAAQAEPAKKNNLLTDLSHVFVRGLAAPVAAVASSVPKLLQGNVSGANEALTRDRSFGVLGHARPIGVDQETGQKQKFGQVAKEAVGSALEIGSYLAPVGAAESVGAHLLEGGAEQAAKKTLLQGVKEGAKYGALSGGVGSLGSGLQKDQSFGKTVGQTVTGGLLGGATGGLLPVAGAATKKVAEPIIKTAGRLGSEILGITTGAGESSIHEAFNNPNVIKFARQARREGPEGLLSQALEDARNGLDSLTSGNSKAYREAMDRIKASPQDLSLAISDARSQIVQEAQESFGVRFSDGKKLNNLDFNASDVVEGAPSVQRAFDRLFGEPISSVEELDRVKKSLGRIAKGTPGGSPAQALIYKMKDAVSTVLKEKVPGYAQEMGRFSEAADLADDIQRSLSLGDKASTDTTVKKLMLSMRRNNELRKGMLETLGKSSGKDITGKIAGATLSSLTPRGLAGTLAPTASSIGGISFLINPKTLPLLILYLTTASPRLMAEAVSILGKIKGKTIPLFYQQQLRNLLIQAERELSNPSNSSETQGVGAQ